MEGTATNSVPGPPVHRVTATASKSGPRHGLWAKIDSSALMATPSQSTATSQPLPAAQIRSAEHLALLEDVLSRIEELDGLVARVDASAARRDELASKLRRSDPDSVQALWRHAAETFDGYLSQPIRLGGTAHGLSLQEATDTFRHWSGSVRSSVRGSGGEALQDSPERLTKLLARLTDVAPSISELSAQAERLLGDPAYTLERLTEQAKSRVAAADLTKRRTADLMAATESLTTDIGPRVAALRAAVSSRCGVLAGLADNGNSSSELTAEARAGIRDLEAIDVESLEVRLQSIQAWASKYAADPSLTASVIRHRITSELVTPLEQAELRLAELEIQYQPEQLTQAEVNRQRAQFAALTEQVTAQLDALQARYQILVSVRRRKLGSAPDERYFGAIAKAVNDAISALGGLENELLLLAANVGQAHIDSYSSLRARVLTATQTVRTSLAQSERFASPAALEATLTEAWKEGLRPLTVLMSRADELAARADQLLADFKDHPGLTQSVLAHIQTLTDALRRARSDTQTFLAKAQPATSGQRTHLEAATKAHQRDLEQALAEMTPLGSRESFQALLGNEVLQARLAAEAERAEAERAEQAARARLPEQLSTLERSRRRLAERIRAALGYATSLEAFAPERAERHYAQLDAVLALPLELPALGAPTLGAALGDQAAWLQLEAQATNHQTPFRPIELTISQLTVLLGSGGQLTELLSQLEEQASREPLRRWQSLSRRRSAIDATLRKATQELATVDAERLTEVAAQPPQTEAAYRAETISHEVTRIGTELGRVRSLLQSEPTEHLAGAEALLAEALQIVDRAWEDLAALAARQAAHRQTTRLATDAATKRHRLREKLQAVLAEQPARSQPSVAPVAPTQEVSAPADLPTESTEPEEVSIPVHHGRMTNDE